MTNNICPFCDKKLTKSSLKSNYSVYECRKYEYLRGNPICHYNHIIDNENILKIRYVFAPFGILTDLKEDKSTITIYNTIENSYPFNIKSIETNAIIINKNNFDDIIKKLNQYLLYL